ncbi:MAG: sulfotransferase family 2 domain-containing protein [Flavobacteriales bacterium]|nr:sulfotransferase family 2 domain-containing protein [Flavobacteriales bacterium]MCB9166088.1 sulfotransferase family 2 domain-containing protein [Flavobacteriales bacterium]
MPIAPPSPLTALSDRVRHFYFNKYLLPLWRRDRYHISYSFTYKALWYRVYKVGSRTIDRHFREASGPGGYIYASPMPYLPERYADWFRFAFVRHPVDRLVSAWRNKVVRENYFGFAADQLTAMRELPGFVGWLEGLDPSMTDEHLRAQHGLIDMDHVQFIGRFERFDDDLRQVAQRVGLPLGEVHHLNVTARRPLGIPSELAERIAHVYRRDMELFYPDSGPMG